MKSNDPLMESMPQLDTVSAINRVLAAEHEAREVMQECNRQAEEMLREARERARRIGQRAEHRIQHWYLHSDQHAAKHLKDLDKRAQALQGDILEPPDLSAEWHSAVEQLADELIGSLDQVVM